MVGVRSGVGIGVGDVGVGNGVVGVDGDDDRRGFAIRIVFATRSRWEERKTKVS